MLEVSDLLEAELYLIAHLELRATLPSQFRIVIEGFGAAESLEFLKTHTLIFSLA